MNSVLRNEMGLIHDLVVEDPLGKSDHWLLEFQIQFENNKLESHTRILVLIQGSYIGMRTDLALVDWAERLKSRALVNTGRYLRSYSIPPN